MRLTIRTPQPDCFLLYRIGYRLQPFLVASELRSYAEFYVGKIPSIPIDAGPLERGVVLKLTEPSDEDLCTCALPGALLVLKTTGVLQLQLQCA